MFQCSYSDGGKYPHEGGTPSESQINTSLIINLATSRITISCGLVPDQSYFYQTSFCLGNRKPAGILYPSVTHNLHVSSSIEMTLREVI